MDGYDDGPDVSIRRTLDRDVVGGFIHRGNIVGNEAHSRSRGSPLHEDITPLKRRKTDSAGTEDNAVESGEFE